MLFIQKIREKKIQEYMREGRSMLNYRKTIINSNIV